jgi:hypothetical protein
MQGTHNRSVITYYTLVTYISMLETRLKFYLLGDYASQNHNGEDL